MFELRAELNDDTAATLDQSSTSLDLREVSDIDTFLRELSLSGAVFLDGELAGDWSVRSEMKPSDFPRHLAPDARMIVYHFVRQGPVRCRLEGGKDVTLEEGDLVILTRNDVHFLSSGERVDAVDARMAMGTPDEDGIHHVRLEGQVERRALYCGYLGGSDHPLLDALPAMMVVKTSEYGTWIEQSFRLIVEDLRTASPTMVARMASGIFIEAVRHFVDNHHDAEGMIAALADPIVGRALAEIHADPARENSIADLAAHAGASRSAFMRRFSTAMGCGPKAYRNRLRLSMAAQALRNTCRRIAEIGFAAGYESEEGFSRAFKKAYRVSPREYRRMGQAR